MGTRKLQRDLKKRNPFESVQQEVVISIQRTSDQLQYRFSQLFKEYGLTRPQYNILRILKGEGKPLPSLEIRRRMVTKVPASTSLIDKLIERELVKRSQSATDRRIWYVELTAKGHDLVTKVGAPNLELHSELVGHLSDAECEQLLNLLEKTRAGISAHETTLSKNSV